LVVDRSAVGRRFDARVEAAAYFCVAEATRDLGDPVLVTLTAVGDRLELVISGTDGGDLPLGHMRDRVEAAGGSVSVSGEGGHTVVEVRGPSPEPAVAHR
jgi:hypothetical protein